MNMMALANGASKGGLSYKENYQQGDFCFQTEVQQLNLPTVDFDGADGRAFGQADTLLFDPPPTLPVPGMAHLFAADHQKQSLSWWYACFTTRLD